MYVIPAPVRHVAESGEGFRLTVETTITVSDPVLLPEVAYLRAQLRARGNLFLGPATVGSAVEGIRLELGENPELDALSVPGGVRADGGAPEGEAYLLEIDGSGIRIAARHTEGVHRGLATLLQLVESTDWDHGQLLAAARIADAPRFAWRGLSLDVSRTFHDVAAVKRVIDLLDRYKLNVLHLHLTDDQGWRLEIVSRPLLTEIGGASAAAGRPGGFYTQQQYRELVEYAATRHITVVPEIDMPGHTAAVFAAYPELSTGTADPIAVEGAFGSDQPTSIQLTTLDPELPATWDFVTEVLTELAALTPGRFLHIGGDEAFGMADEAHAAFVDRAKSIVAGLGKQVVGWQEISRAGVGPGDVTQYWIDLADLGSMADNEALLAMVPAEFLPILMATLAKAAHDVDLAVAKGASVIVSPTSSAYLDRPYAEPSSDPAQEELRARVGLPVYPPVTIESSIAWDPAEVADVLDESGIAGVEAAIWCETIANEDELQFMLLPRLPGIAEKAWSPIGSTSWPEYRTRLARQALPWKQAGYSWFRSSGVDWVD